MWQQFAQANTVAPLAGSVDRNDDHIGLAGIAAWSLPSRGAWIEIPSPPYPCRAAAVAPLAGSVDRNGAPLVYDATKPASLPSRGAWIEIGRAGRGTRLYGGRSPRGERG